MVPFAPTIGAAFATVTALTTAVVPARASADPTPLPAGKFGRWTTGYQSIVIPKMGAVASFELGLILAPGTLTMRVRNLSDVFASLRLGGNIDYVFDVLGVETATPVPIGKAGVVPQELYWFTLRPVQAYETLYDELEVVKANEKARCGVTGWKVAVPMPLVGTTCVKGTLDRSGRVPVAWNGGLAITAITTITAIEPDDPADPCKDAQDTCIELGEMVDLTLEELNPDLPLRKIPDAEAAARVGAREAARHFLRN